TCLLHVTRDFLRHFGLSSVEEFRFHFPTAAEENAEALARAPHSGSDYDEPEEESADGAAIALETPSGHATDGVTAYDHDETQDPEDSALASTNTESVGADESAPLAIEESDGPEPEESDESPELLASDTEPVTNESDIEDESDEE
ncbi:hypothetical protein IH601_05985, partial [Candidatus Bipolaricaulota bacterium]|nr:hypothetical protein [Candidatus Bipolaricaulota bacterium]